MLCWADRVALFVLLLVYMALFFVGLTGGGIAVMFSWAMIQSIWIPIGLKVFLPVWIFLRFIDMLIGGPARRRGRITGRIVE